MKSPVAERARRSTLLFHPHAYVFLSEALKVAQEIAGAGAVASHPPDEPMHISGAELMEGVRVLGLRQYGAMAPTVFHHWGISSTDDFGRLVFEMIDRGEMRKSERDQLSDFSGLFTFEDAFMGPDVIDVSRAFKRS